MKKTSPLELLAAKDVTVLASVSSAIAEPLPVTEKAPASTAPIWSTAPAALIVTVPPVIPVSVRSPAESVTTTLPAPLVIATESRVLIPVRLIAAPAPSTTRSVALSGPEKERAWPTVRVVVPPETDELAKPVIVPAAADSVVVPPRVRALSIAPAPEKAMLPAVAVRTIALPRPVVCNRPVIVTLVPMIVMVPSVV